MSQIKSLSRSASEWVTSAHVPGCCGLELALAGGKPEISAAENPPGMISPEDRFEEVGGMLRRKVENHPDSASFPREEIARPTVLEYVVVSQPTDGDLMYAVNERLGEGWRLQGGVALSMHSERNGNGDRWDEWWYAQALVREKKP